MLVCVQCAMEAYVKGEKPPVFSESNDEHMARLHPDPMVTQKRRLELNRLCFIKMREEGHFPKDGKFLNDNGEVTD